VKKEEKWEGREGGRDKARSGVGTREREKVRMGMREGTYGHEKNSC